MNARGNVSLLLWCVLIFFGALPGQAENVVLITSDNGIWVTLLDADIVRSQQKQQKVDAGINAGWAGFQFWPNTIDPRVRVLGNTSFVPNGIRFTAEGVVPSLRIALLPPDSDLPNLFSKILDEIEDIDAAFIGIEETYGHTGLKEALNTRLMGLLKETDLTVVESWNMRFPIPEPLRLPLEGSMIGGTEGDPTYGLDFFRTHDALPLLSDFYLYVANAEYRKDRTSAWLETLRNIRDLVAKYAATRLLPPADMIASLYNPLFEVIRTGVHARESDIPEKVQELDTRLADLRRQWFAERSRLAGKNSANAKAASPTIVEIDWEGVAKSSVLIHLGENAKVNFNASGGSIETEVDPYITSYPPIPGREMTPAKGINDH